MEAISTMYLIPVRVHLTMTLHMDSSGHICVQIEQKCGNSVNICLTIFYHTISLKTIMNVANTRQGGKPSGHLGGMVRFFIKGNTARDRAY